MPGPQQNGLSTLLTNPANLTDPPIPQTSQPHRPADYTDQPTSPTSQPHRPASQLHRPPIPPTSQLHKGCRLQPCHLDQTHQRLTQGACRIDLALASQPLHVYLVCSVERPNGASDPAGGQPWDMVHHASPCPIMLRHASPCFAMLHHASSCFTMLHHASSCFTMPHHASSCFAMDKDQDRDGPRWDPSPWERCCAGVPYAVFRRRASAL